MNGVTEGFLWLSAVPYDMTHFLIKFQNSYATQVPAYYMRQIQTSIRDTFIKFFFKVLVLSNVYILRGAWTDDPEIKSHTHTSDEAAGRPKEQLF